MKALFYAIVIHLYSELHPEVVWKSTKAWWMQKRADWWKSRLMGTRLVGNEMRRKLGIPEIPLTYDYSPDKVSPAPTLPYR